MSLKVIHLAIILFSIALTLFFGFWATAHYLRTQNTSSLVWGMFSSFMGIALIPYWVWFFIKSKKSGWK